MKATRTVVAAGLFAVSALVAFAWSSSRKRQAKSSVRLDDEFEEAAKKIRQMEDLDDEGKLMFYALYKQATEGDAPSTMTVGSWNLIVEHAKHSVWSNLRGMPHEVARKMYIAAANKVDELEGTGMNGFNHTVSLPAMENGGLGEEDLSSLESRLLSAASANDTKTLLILLLNGGANVNHKDELGQTALHLAADKGALSCVQALVKHGADVNASDQDGVTPLQTAVIADQVEVCRHLLDYANPDQPDNDGDTARSCAADSADMRQISHLSWRWCSPWSITDWSKGHLPPMADNL
jgi:acyl-CoA-binding protein